MTITAKTPVTVSPKLAIANLGDEAVLLDAESGNYFGLNEVASRILDLARTAQTVESIVERLAEEYDVEREVLFADVVSFVRELEANGLVTTQG